MAADVLYEHNLTQCYVYWNYKITGCGAGPPGGLPEPSEFIKESTSCDVNPVGGGKYHPV